MLPCEDPLIALPLHPDSLYKRPFRSFFQSWNSIQIVGQAFQPADSLSSESSRPEGRLAATIGRPTGCLDYVGLILPKK
jgi:hypothetical protein